ncbi:MAG: amino acid ABC transporter substrate-binding protein [Peptococcaceae bacterium]|jgi:polar amino acid transport system substrate-binding protein|nr:amino acid ABC transporter substrate-binding protein [Peptococcaceae bacterium]
MKKLLTILLICLMGMTILAGCGDDAATAPDNNGGAAGGETPEGQGEAGRKFVMGLDDSFAPMGFRDENGNIAGFDVDLATEVCKRLGYELVLQPIDWDSKEVELDTGNIDCIWNGFSVTPERQESMEMSVPYIANAQVIITKKDSGITAKADLAGKEIGVQKGSSAKDAVEGDELIDIIGKMSEYPTNVDAFNDLVAGRLSAVVADVVIAKYYMGTDAYAGLEIIGDALAPEDYAVGFKKGNTELKDAVEGALKEMVADGTAAQISTKWFGEDIMVIK